MSVGANNYYCPICSRNISSNGVCPDCKDKIPVISGEIDLKTGKSKKHTSYRWKDEETDCEYFYNFDGTGCINVCKGNEPYSCHRSKKEKLCHKVKSKGK